jgi:hypothetical protein
LRVVGGLQPLLREAYVSVGEAEEIVLAPWQGVGA